MSSTYAEPFARLEACLDEIGSVDPVYRTTTEKQEALVGLSRVIARAQAERQRVLAAADDVAEATGDRSTAAWLASTTRDAHGAVRADARLGAALESRWTRVQAAFTAGEVNLAQVRVIDKALTDLTGDLGDDLLAKAEAFLVNKAAELGPRDLAILGSRLMEYLAPEIADQAEYQLLLQAEDRATAATRLSFRPRGDGSTDVHGRLPTTIANRLRVYLDGYTSPRNKRLGDLSDLPGDHKRGIAFCALLENLPASGLPRQGGVATTISVKIDLHTLLANLAKAGVALTSTGDKITAGQARRLACQAGILPHVMSGKSVVLDQGRKKRFHDDNQRAAIYLHHDTCAEAECDIPAAWTEIHHPIPWSEGGHTDLSGVPLCPFHHHRAHHPGWAVTYHPDGTTTFHRRQ
jgi:hypothetical protein